ncbi:MAG TPA: hypothetical protein VNZ22_19265, partial [Bacillota bacterium]|nr:hypothetical protein [Bacillota bacterium]
SFASRGGDAKELADESTDTANHGITPYRCPSLCQYNFVSRLGAPLELTMGATAPTNVELNPSRHSG